MVALDLNGSGWMRAPGNMPGAFALETAMDEVARTAGIDPIELRRRNHADVDPVSGKPFAQKGSGRARQGTIRAPHMRGGGVTFGPKPRSFAFKLTKNVRSLISLLPG